MAATLRPGNVPSADDWDDLLLPEIERQQAEGNRVAFRADAAFAKPEIYDALEKRDVDYAIRIPANKSLELKIEEILFRSPGRPSCKPLARISDLAVVPYRQDQSPRLDFWGTDVRNDTREGDTLWVDYNTSHFSSSSTVS